MPALAHLGIGFAAKRFSPQIPLWASLISSILIDLLSFIFLFALWPSHGLFMSVVWSISAIFVTALVISLTNSRKDKSKMKLSSLWNKEILSTSLIIGGLVFSHWILDFIGWPMSVIDPSLTGTPLLFDDTITIGLGVYSTWFGTLLMDIGIFVIGLVIYISYKKRIKK